MFYKNISQTHEHKKVPIIISELKNAINDFDITQVIILGAQNREDVYQLIVQSLCFLNPININTVKYNTIHNGFHSNHSNCLVMYSIAFPFSRYCVFNI